MGAGLAQNRDALDALIAALLERETISGEDLAAIVGRLRDLDNAPDPVTV